MASRTCPESRHSHSCSSFHSCECRHASPPSSCRSGTGAGGPVGFSRCARKRLGEDRFAAPVCSGKTFGSRTRAHRGSRQSSCRTSVLVDEDDDVLYVTQRRAPFGRSERSPVHARVSARVTRATRSGERSCRRSGTQQIPPCQPRFPQSAGKPITCHPPCATDHIGSH